MSPRLVRVVIALSLAGAALDGLPASAAKRSPERGAFLSRADVERKLAA
jgi:hypothetical protein